MLWVKFFLVDLTLLMLLGSQNACGVLDFKPKQKTPSPTPTPTPTPEIWQPAISTSWQLQLTGTIDTSLPVQMYDIDLFDASQDTIDQLHAQGIKVICYFSAGTKEAWRTDVGDLPASAVGNALGNYPDENWLDIRDATVRKIMAARMDTAVSKKCDGLDPDNVDAFTYDTDGNDQNDTGFGLTASDQLDYNRFLATEAHARVLGIGLKNDVDQIAELINYFDWMIDEECFYYNECDKLLPFVQQGKAVFEIEYGDQTTANNVCQEASSRNFNTLIKNKNLDNFRIPCP